MPCISRSPRCGSAEAPVAPKPATTFFVILGFIGGAVTLVKAAASFKVVNSTIVIGTTVIGSATVGGLLVGAAAALAMIAIIAIYVFDRCVPGDTAPQCVAGVVVDVENSFSSALDQLLPFTAMHDRVDVVVKSHFWDVVESGLASVHCTAESPPRTSEIMRCYFYDKQVCMAGDGALVGAGVGAVAGIVAATAAAAAITCLTLFLCLIALFVAAVIAAAAVLAGALIGGQIGKAAAGEDLPTAGTGETLAIGQLVTVRGNMKRRDEDDGANVLWWSTSANLHGISRSPQPYSYCELDEELPTDGCFRPPEIR